MKILAHRGWWRRESEKNSIYAFKRALDNGFGIETDLRDHNQEIVISHDCPGADVCFLDSFWTLYEGYKGLPLALNVKADGLQDKLESHAITSQNAFYFDMSVPDTLGYLRRRMPVFSRYSEYEKEVSFLDESIGVWVDRFTDGFFDEKAIGFFLRQDKCIALVSPELHGYEYDNYWVELKYFLRTYPEFSKKILICTDVPMRASEFFYEYQD